MQSRFVSSLALLTPPSTFGFEGVKQFFGYLFDLGALGLVEFDIGTGEQVKMASSSSDKFFEILRCSSSLRERAKEISSTKKVSTSLPPALWSAMSCSNLAA